MKKIFLLSLLLSIPFDSSFTFAQSVSKHVQVKSTGSGKTTSGAPVSVIPSVQPGVLIPVLTTLGISSSGKKEEVTPVSSSPVSSTPPVSVTIPVNSGAVTPVTANPSISVTSSVSSGSVTPVTANPSLAVSIPVQAQSQALKSSSTRLVQQVIQSLQETVRNIIKSPLIQSTIKVLKDIPLRVKSDQPAPTSSVFRGINTALAAIDISQPQASCSEWEGNCRVVVRVKDKLHMKIRSWKPARGWIEGKNGRQIGTGDQVNAPQFETLITGTPAMITVDKTYVFAIKDTGNLAVWCTVEGETKPYRLAPCDLPELAGPVMGGSNLVAVHNHVANTLEVFGKSPEGFLMMWRRNLETSDWVGPTVFNEGPKMRASMSAVTSNTGDVFVHACDGEGGVLQWKYESNGTWRRTSCTQACPDQPWGHCLKKEGVCKKKTRDACRNLEGNEIQPSCTPLGCACPLGCFLDGDNTCKVEFNVASEENCALTCQPQIGEPPCSLDTCTFTAWDPHPEGWGNGHGKTFSNMSCHGTPITLQNANGDKLIEVYFSTLEVPRQLMRVQYDSAWSDNLTKVIASAHDFLGPIGLINIPNQNVLLRDGVVSIEGQDRWVYQYTYGSNPTPTLDPMNTHLQKVEDFQDPFKGAVNAVLVPNMDPTQSISPVMIFAVSIKLPEFKPPQMELFACYQHADRGIGTCEVVGAPFSNEVFDSP